VRGNAGRSRIKELTANAARPRLGARQRPRQELGRAGGERERERERRRAGEKPEEREQVGAGKTGEGNEDGGGSFGCCSGPGRVWLIMEREREETEEL
jgi:hypothetical protein